MSLTRLEKMDPCLDWAPEDERAARLDEVVERLCAADATAPSAAPATLVAPRRWFSAPRLAAVGATGLALAAGAAFGLPGGGNGLEPSDARAALASAAKRTAAFTSGRVTWIESVTTPFTLTSKNVIRYQGADSSVESVSESVSPGPPAAPPPAGRVRSSASGFRSVGGQRWAREGNGPWKKFSLPAGMEISERDTFKGQAGLADALVDLVRSAPDVTSEARDGATHYRSSVAGAEIPDPFPWREVRDRVQLDVVVRDDGAVHRFTLAGGGRTLDVTFDDLGADQGITAP
jgi:hypothetical protein